MPIVKTSITRDNDVAYNDKLFIQAPSVTEFLASGIVDPDPTEEIEIPLCDCEETHQKPQEVIIVDKKGIDLSTGELRPSWPTPDYHRFPKEFNKNLDPSEMNRLQDMHPPVPEPDPTPVTPTPDPTPSTPDPSTPTT